MGGKGSGWHGPHTPNAGFQKGHGAFPGNRGNAAMRGVWKRPDKAGKNNVHGFQPGHPSYYTGGSVIGHLPTRRRNELDGTLGRAMPKLKKSRHKECEIMEALQNGKRPADLKKRYPPLQVERLAMLHDVAIDATHRDFIKAQILVREILVRNRDGGEDGGGEKGHTITLLHGEAVAPPLPGSVNPLPGTAPAAVGGGSEAPTGAERG